MSARAAETAPVDGVILTRPFKVLAGLFAAALVVVAYRFVYGVGSVTALSDAYAWGVWKPFSVIVLTAMASGGYAFAVMVYVLNRGRYHHLARTALLTSALGYTTGVMTLGVDIGRPWNFYQIPFVWNWNLHSVLLEVTVCITLYVIVMWLELSPPFLEAGRTSNHAGLRRMSTAWLPRINRAFPWIVALAVVLPSMHQSSLGSLFLLAGPRIHPLWQTPLVPLLFLLSCYFMGFAAVALVSLLSSLAWGRPKETRMLGSVMHVGAWIALAFLVIRVADVFWRQQAALLLQPTVYAALFWAEALLVGIPALLLLSRAARANATTLFRLCIVIAIGGGLYRLDTSLVAFMPGENFGYFPSVLEMVVSAGFMALAILGYLFIVKRFSILPAAQPAASRS
jgi:Ni/Fe-hydrogenase subunit HybB-like protein